jgi:16S rRNA (uracil1498-N3)-methyltransferase
MARYDFRTPRLFVETALQADVIVALAAEQANYLRNVLRLRGGDAVLAFNGRDGEWRGELRLDGKSRGGLVILEQIRGQTAQADLHLIFAPIKHARLDYLVQKAVEMGVSGLLPVFTRHTQPHRVNLKRMRANAIEAAQQCGILKLPAITEPIGFDQWLVNWPARRPLIFCDEEAAVAEPLAALAAAHCGAGLAPPLGVLVGPEGGFDSQERAALLKLPNAIRLSLGPRILRADTAVVAALALVQAVLGDWR